jgi:truncated hemoglobin YjbI
MQSLLLTFTQIKDTIFTQATPAILDLATRMGGDLNGAAIQVGKALNDPIKGITALSRVGVSFSEAQKSQIENFVKTNQLAEAQKMILAELNTEFGGSAEAAALVGLGPWQQLQNTFGDVQEQIGEIVLKMGKELLPVVQKLVTGLGNLATWISENSSKAKVLAAGIGSLILTFKIAIPVMEGMGIATTAMLGPLGLALVAVGALSLAFYELANAEDIARQAHERTLKSTNENIKSTLQERTDMYVKQGMKQADAVKKVTDGTRKTYLEDIAQTQKDIEATQSKMSSLKALGYTSQADAMQVGLEKLGQKKAQLEAGLSGVNEFAQMGLATPKAPAGGAENPNGNPTPTKAKSVAQGTKVTTINVSIKDLIGEYNLNVTNVREGSEKVKQMVVDALTGAVNDFQLIVQ